jgi:hypothetical protein
MTHAWRKASGRAATFFGVVWLATCVASLVACHRDEGGAPVLSEVLTGRYHVGDTWNYKTRPGEEGSTLTVVKVESTPKLGVIVHVSLVGLRVHSKHAPTGISDRIAHMPFSADAVDRSVTTVVARATLLPDFKEGYDEWRTAFDQNKAGIFTISVADAVGVVESTLQN